MQAVWRDQVLAESDQTIVVEGNHYFPADSVRQDYFRASDAHTTCHWKGVASYYDIVVNGELNRDAAWYYPQPSDAAKQITSYVAFWKGVVVK